MRDECAESDNNSKTSHLKHLVFFHKIVYLNIFIDFCVSTIIRRENNIIPVTIFLLPSAKLAQFLWRTGTSIITGYSSKCIIIS